MLRFRQVDTGGLPQRVLESPSPKLGVLIAEQTWIETGYEGQHINSNAVDLEEVVVAVPRLERLTSVRARVSVNRFRGGALDVGDVKAVRPRIPFP